MIFNMDSGGNASFNFKIVGGTSAPSSASENTIWINTSTAITSWIFSTTQPSGSSGMVWIKTGLYSMNAFNALKKNGIQIYPLNAYQYNGSSWVSKPIKIYQGGAWKTPEVYLYNYDKLGYTWQSVGKAISSDSGGDPVAPTVTTSSSGVMNIDHTETYDGDRYNTGIVYITQKIDFSQANTLTFNGVLTTNKEAKYCSRLCIWSNIGEYVSTNLVKEIQAEVNGTVTLDVSTLTGSYYVGFSIHDTTSTVALNYLKLT